MKKKTNLIFILLLFIFTPSLVGAKESLTADVYYFENLEEIGYKLGQSDFSDLSGKEKREISTKLRAYSFYKGLRPIRTEGFSLVEKTDPQGTFLEVEKKDLTLDKKGFYLFVFEKKQIDKLLVSAKDLLIYYDEKLEVQPKIDSKAIEGSTGEASDYLDVIFDMGDFHFYGPLRVGLYNSAGDLIQELSLDPSNNYRGRFSGLNLFENYSIWPMNLGVFDFLEDQEGHLVFIRLIKSIEKDGNQDQEDIPGWIIGPKDEEENIKDHPKDPDDLDHKDNEKTEDQDEEIKKPEKAEEEKPENKDDGSNMNEDKKPLEKQKLPQTGLLWLPVPFLFGAGIIFLALARKNDED